MRRTRGRKPRVVWLPTFGDSAYAEGGGFGQATGIRLSTTHGSGGSGPGIIYDAVAVTWDGGDSSAAAQDFGSTEHSLADFVQGQSYRLRRIVGKFWCGTDIQTASNINALQVAFGFIVGRADSNGSLQTDFNNVNPLYQDSADDPWIWRRSWLLGAGSYGSTVQWGNLPLTNQAVGSAVDGPHIDQKTARLVGPDERLVCIMAARVFSTHDDAAPTGNVRVSGFLDYRILASMRSNVGNRRNASR